jgi:NADPH:quinone reductase-like Zn-dependent oxidoreductase
MRAIVYDRYGPPEVLRLADVPRPSPKANELLIRVVATAAGAWWQNPLLQIWTGIVGGQQAGLAIPDAKRVREDVQLLREIIEAKGLRPEIDRTYPLAEIVEAHRYVDTEQKTGSVVIRVAGST